MFTVLLSLAPLGLDADELRVAVAGNFLPAFERLAPEFESRTGHRLRPSSGSTGKLYAQIRQGAPFDLFLAADAERPGLLEAAGYGVAGTRATYARGRLALWAPGAIPGSDPGDLLLAEPAPRLAVANPRVAPYGAAAEDYLRRRGLWAIYEGRAVRGEGVAQAFHFVASGNAALGLVALSQVMLAPEPLPGAWREVPRGMHRPIEQQALLLRDTAAGRALLAWLLSGATQDRLRGFGYDSP